MMPRNEEQLAILTDRQGREVALKGVKARARLQGLLAEVEVEQSYLNPQDTNIEAVYTFPLPFGSVLLGLEVEIAGKKLTGQVVEKKVAERRYEDAVTDGDSAVMLEEAGPGLYTASLGNLMAGESAAIRYRYGLLLNWQGDRLRFLLPTTIAPRYGDAAAAGLQPHQVPESSLTVEYPLDLTVDVEGDLATAAIASPSHAITMERTDTGLRIRLDKRAFLDRDFVLTLASDSVQSSCVVVPDGDGHVALASLRIPPDAELERQPLTLKLVIDCSGSMAGTSITQARKAGLAILDQLRPEDRFDVTLFGSDYKHCFRGLMPATAKYITQAWGWIERMDANMGGTEMERALEASFHLKGDGPAGTVLLITDGEIHEHGKLVKHAEKSGQRVFVVGVGNSVAETFLRRLAERTGGACELVAPQEGMGEFVLTQFHRMRQKRLGDLKLGWPTGPDWTSRLPETVFAGDTVHAVARFDGMPEGLARLLIEGGGEVAVPLERADNAEIPRLAAARRLDELATTIADKPSDTLARDLAVRYQLVSPWTNYLVVAERADKAEELPEIHKVPQMLAAGWGGSGIAESVRCYSLSLPDTVDDLFVIGRSRDSRAQAMSSTGMDKYDIPAFLRKSADDDGAPSPSRGARDRVRFSRKSPTLTESVADKLAKFVPGFMRPFRSEKIGSPDDEMISPNLPAEFIGMLESLLSADLRSPELPEWIFLLGRCGLLAEIVRSLEALQQKGYAEADIVAAFVHALSKSAVGVCFGRPFKRAILLAWKQAAPPAELDRAMQDALAKVAEDAWNWQQKPLDRVQGVPAQAA